MRHHHHSAAATVPRQAESDRVHHHDHERPQPMRMHCIRRTAEASDTVSPTALMATFALFLERAMIGELLGMVIGTALGQLSTIALAVAL